MGYWFAGDWYNHAEITLSVTDPSFLYGATIFTTLRVFKQDLEHPDSHWQAHGDRLRYTIKKLQWSEPNWQNIEIGAARIAEDYPVLRVTLFSDGRELIIGRQLPAQLAKKQQSGITAWVATESIYRRPMADFKTGNYMGAWQARQRAIAAGSGEAILIDTQGHWLETTTGNLWGFDGKQWHTPPTQGILPGVMRSHLIQQLQRSEQSVSEAHWTIGLLKTFEAIAYSNSVVGVIPITTIKNITLQYSGAADHKAVRSLQNLSGCCKSV
ncbi:aminotransferase class IV [[Leptolyngbya] sp. PCC 7376]|uniref:aminotransferase class IV n=1 Tax=[Leptolyngbya] sp. PCC 7376 TaxID=111781 RepID=UPI00029F2AF8|nr:aminotransferase class IV [[Leptolyngbya] sp. PCC 7376]AFY39056.1 aminotransferase class IV [[Leptolyngbya] sp. PCC 7376]